MRCASLLLVTLLCIGCDRSKEPMFDEAEWTQRGAAAVAPFKKSLKQALIDGLAKGPKEAVAACQLEAPKLTGALDSQKVKVGRTSHKLRNPSNAPKPWMQPLLDSYLESPKEGGRAIEIDATTVGYVEPIYLQPMCLTCHGAGIAKTVEEKIIALYPNDRATGFAPGDFRGLFWAELKR